jgi:hypothetical protein
MHSVLRFQRATIHVDPYQGGRPMPLEIIGHHLNGNKASGPESHGHAENF